MARERILVVDDEPLILAAISAMLSGSGYTPVKANSGAEGLNLIQTGPPFDLVLTDIMMNDIDGMALLERSRAVQPQTPMVMMTGTREISVAVAAIRKGAYDILLKPFERGQLLATVRRALDHGQSIQQNVLYQKNLEQLVAERTELLRQTMTELEHSYDITLEALGDALDLKDAETEGHSKRVTAFTVAIAKAMDLRQDQIRVLARGAFLHDIGKMAIPDAILLKPGRLDRPEEFTMREHCARGYQMLRKIPFLAEPSEIVYSHQEHYDGSGYPRGLKGDEIPLGARIFAIADTLDAITSDRPYRNANTFSAARKEIQRCAGTQFDPAIVACYSTLPDQLWQDLRAAITNRAKRLSPFAIDYPQ